ncbi:MAG: hypothetical protein JJ863_23770 [Deltaproteobacteria bacterium]|nr:hypothetical protein [Deltaproteobacteria bacterium]
MRAALAIALVLAAGCEEDEPEAPAADIVSDAADIQRVLADDLAMLSLEEVETAVDDDLPARAAELLEQGAIPNVRRQRTAIEELTPGTDDGRALQTEALQLLDARIAALESYREVLARGLVADDLALLDAIRAQRLAEEGITGLFARLEEIHPLPEASDEDDVPVRRVRPNR